MIVKFTMLGAETIQNADDLFKVTCSKVKEFLNLIREPDVFLSKVKVMLF